MVPFFDKQNSIRCDQISAQELFDKGRRWQVIGRIDVNDIIRSGEAFEGLLHIDVQQVRLGCRLQDGDIFPDGTHCPPIALDQGGMAGSAT